MGRGHDHVTHI